MAEFFQRIRASILSFRTMLTGFFAGTPKQPETPVQTPDPAPCIASVREADLTFSADRIHFLNTDNSDAILLESDGHFAMVDAGEDTDNPRGFPGLDLPGFEDRVLAYLKAHAAGADGKVHLDFIVGTHAHSDHLGGFDTILADPDVFVGRAYLKVYDSSVIREHEILAWDNQEVYDQTVAALEARGVPIVSTPDGTPFTLGKCRITLFNTDGPVPTGKLGENDRSLGVLVETNGTRVFLAGDMNNDSGDETRLAPQIGKVDLLKVGHHGCEGSSTPAFLQTLMPKICVFTTNEYSHNVRSRERIPEICGAKMYFTAREGGVLALLGKNGDVRCYGQIHSTNDPPGAAAGIYFSDDRKRTTGRRVPK